MCWFSSWFIRLRYKLLLYFQHNICLLWFLESVDKYTDTIAAQKLCFKDVIVWCVTVSDCRSIWKLESFSILEMFSKDYLCFLRIFCCMMIAMTSLIWGQFNQRNWLLTLCLYLYHEFTRTINYRRWLELAQVQITKLLFFLLGFLTNINIQVEGSLLNAANFGTQDDYHCYASS